jgi:hypothetical protein
MEKSRIRNGKKSDPELKKVGSGINIPDPQHCIELSFLTLLLTQGGVATGKSTVSNMLRDLGVPVIDADAMARRIVEPGRTAWRAIK